MLLSADAVAIGEVADPPGHASFGEFDSAVEEVPWDSAAPELAAHDDSPVYDSEISGTGLFDGISGSEAGMNEWLLNRGLSPDKLSLEPLTDGYSDLVQSLVNVGYTNGVDLFAVTWDWRTPVALQDGTADGTLNLSGLPGYSIQDTIFESGLDYFGWFLEQASNTWQSLKGALPDSVDVITHSTGGLVARSYLQSDFYEAADPTPDTLPEINTLIQVGVPNQGIGAALDFLLDDFSLKPASRTIGRVLDIAYKLITEDGLTIQNPDGTTISAGNLVGAIETERRIDFLLRYIRTLNDLLATFPFLDSDGDGVLESLTGSGPLENGTLLTPDHTLPSANALLLDLNFSGPAAFASIPAKTRIVYSDELETRDRAVRYDGPQPSLGIKNELLSFIELIGRLPGDGEVWYNMENDPGDGTVSAHSASDGFSSGLVPITRVDAGATEAIGHSELVQNAYAQRVILAELPGLSSYQDVSVNDISTDRVRGKVSAAQELLNRGVVDPVALAVEAFGRIQGLIADIEQTLHSAMTQPLPLVNQSIDELLFNDANPTDGIGLDFFDRFAQGVADFSGAATLADLEALIETELGLSDAQFELTLVDGVLTLGFDFSLNRSLAFDLDLGQSDNPLTGVLPLTLDLELLADFALSMDLGGYLADPKDGFGAESLAVELNEFQLGATLAATDLNLDLEYDGFGTLSIVNGTASVTGVFDVSFVDSDDTLSLGELRTAPSFLDLVNFNHSVPLSLNLPVTFSVDDNQISLTGIGTVGVSSSDLLNGLPPPISFDGSLTEWTLFGSVTGTADFAVEVFSETTAELDATGEVIFPASTVVVLAVSNFNLDLGPVELVNGSGVFLLTDDGLAGEAEVEVEVTVSNDIRLEGTFGLALNTTSAAINRRVTVGGESVSLLVPEGPTLRLVGTGVELEAFGQLISGNFSLTRDDDGIRGGMSGVHVFLGVDGKGFEINDGRGALVLADEGLALEASGAISLTGIPDVSLTAERMAVQVNTTGDQVSASVETGEFADDGTPVTVDLDLAPNSFRFSGDNVALTVGEVTVSGSFAVEVFTETTAEFDPTTGEVVFVDSTVIVLAIRDFTLDLGPVKLVNGSGVFLFTEDGFAGEAEVNVEVTASSDISLTGTFGLAFNTTSEAINRRVTVGGESVSLLLPAGPTIRLVGTDVSLVAFGQLVSGNFNLTRDDDGIRGGMSGVEVFLGTGAGTSQEKGFRISDGRGALVLTDDGVALEASGAISLTGVPSVSLTAERMTLQVNTTGDQVTESVATGEFADDGTPVTVDLDIAPDTFQFSGENVALTAGGVSLSGSFAVERFQAIVNNVVTEVIQVSVSQVSTELVIGSGTSGVKFAASGIDGAFLFNDSGVAGLLTVGSVSLTDADGGALPGLSAANLANLKLELNTTGAGVSATIGSVSFDFSAPEKHDFVALSGQLDLIVTSGGVSATLTTGNVGSLTFQKSTIALNGTDTDVFQVAAVDLTTELTIGTGSNGVKTSASGINGVFILTSAGVAGRLEVGNFAVTDADGNPLPFLSAANVNNFILELNTTNGPVSTTVGGLPLDFSASDRHNFVLAGGDLDLGITVGAVSATVEGRFFFEKTTLSVNGTNESVFKVSVSAARTILTLGSAPGGVRASFLDITGALILKSGGAAGKLSIGRIELTRADGVTPLGGDALGFTVSDFNVAFNNTGAAVSAAIDSVVLDFTSAQNFLSLSGTLDLNLAGLATVSGRFGFQKNGSEIRVVAEDVVASLTAGSFSVGLTGGKLVLLLRDDGTRALDASGTLTLDGAGFANATADSVRVQYNNTGTDFSDVAHTRTLSVNGVSRELATPLGTPVAPFIGFSVDELHADLAGFVTIAGSFSFEKGFTEAGTSIIKVGVSDFSVALGDGNTDFVSVTGTQGALMITDAGLAGTITATVSASIPGVALDPTPFTVEINTIDAPVRETFRVGGQAIVLDLPEGPYLRAVADPLNLTVLGFTLSGRIAFEQARTSGGDRIVIVSASEIGISGFDGPGTDAPVDITDAQGVLVVTDQGVAGSLDFVAEAAFGGFDADAKIRLEINDTGRAVDFAGDFGSITFEAGNFIRVVAGIDLSFPGLEVSGTFSFRTSSAGQVIVGTKVNVFVGDNTGIDPIGLQLTDGQAIFISENGKKTGFITGRVQLLGVNGLTLDAILTLKFNERTDNTGLPQSITLDGDTIPFDFTSGEVADQSGNSFIQFTGSSVRLSVADVVELRGNFAFARQAGKFLVGATGTSAFVGSGPAWLNDGSLNPDALGVLVEQITFKAVVLDNGKFAFDGMGTPSFLGLPGMGLDDGAGAAALFAVRLNRTGAEVHETIPGLGGAGALDITDVSGTPLISGGARIQVPGAFELSGTLGLRQLPGGLTSVSVQGASLTVPAFGGGTPVFAVSGSAEFRMGGLDGFRLQEFRTDGFVILGEDLLDSVPNIQNRSLTADLASPFGGSVADRTQLNEQGYIDIVFNDVNGLGLSEGTVDGDEFDILLNGQNVTSTIQFQSPPVRIFDTTFRYAFSGGFAQDGEYTVEFVEDSWTDTGGNGGAREVESFVLVSPVGGAPLEAAPTAELVNPAGGVILDPKQLNSRRFIDVSFVIRGDAAIDPASINGDELLLSGSAVLDGAVAAGDPLHLYKDTYRYFLIDSDTSNATSLFQNGELTVTFQANTFAAGTGGQAIGNQESREVVVLDAAKSATVTSTKTIPLGPLTLVNPAVGIQDMSYADGRLLLTVALSLDSASLNFGSSASSAVTASLSGILATFDLGVGLPGNFSVSSSGKFSLSVAALELVIPNAVEVSASDIRIQFDPNGPADQELVRIDSASIVFPAVNIAGTIAPTQTDAGLIPGLVVRGDGFTLGEATLIYGGAPQTGESAATPVDSSQLDNGKIKIGSFLVLDDIRVGVRNFEVNFDSSSIDFDGSIFVATGGAALFPNGPFSATITDRAAADDRNDDGTQNTEAMRAELTFNNGQVNGLLFQVDTLKLTLGGVLTVTAQKFDLDTGATGTDPIVSFGSIGATLKVGKLEIGGQARNFGFTRDGDFVFLPGKPFGVLLSVDGVSGSALGWPSWLPIKITTLGAEWEDIQNNPEDFTLILSASVTGLPGNDQLQFSGSIDGIRIRPSLLLEGKFPIVDIGGIGVTVSGKAFGGEISGGLIGGILRVVDDGSSVTLADEFTPDADVTDRIFFMGVQGGFSMAGMAGFTIRFALSELGPLGVFINVEVPGGIVLVPPIGLAVNNFAAGVEFFKTLPAIDNALDLRDPVFNVTGTVQADTWLASVKDQVFQQFLAVRANPNLNGFSAAFTSPMLIKGSAQLFTIFTSKESFNVQGDLIISTDGKILLNGIFNFADDNLTTSAKLYADLSNVSDGDVTVLFLQDSPNDQIALVTVDGKLKFGFRDDTGAEVAVPVVPQTPVNTNEDAAGALVFPGAGEIVDVGRLNQDPAAASLLGGYYVDVLFEPGANRTLDYASILDQDSEIIATLTTADGTVTTLHFDGAAEPIETTVDPVTGAAIQTILSGATPEDLEAAGIRQFRYRIDANTHPGFLWAPGEVTVTVTGGTWEQNEPDDTSTANVESSASFTIQGPTVSLSNPSDGGRIQISQFAERMYLDVIFTPTGTAGAVMDLTSAPYLGPDELELGGPGLGSVAISGAPQLVSTAGTSPQIFRYPLSGAFAPGEVTLTFKADQFQDSGGAANLEQVLSFVVDGTTADLASPTNGGSVGLTDLGGTGSIDVAFNPAGGSAVDPATLIDGQPELEIILADGTLLVVDDDPTEVGPNLFQYAFTGTLGGRAGDRPVPGRQLRRHRRRGQLAGDRILLCRSADRRAGEPGGRWNLLHRRPQRPGQGQDGGSVRSRSLGSILRTGTHPDRGRDHRGGAGGRRSHRFRCERDHHRQRGAGHGWNHGDEPVPILLLRDVQRRDGIVAVDGHLEPGRRRLAG